MKNRYEKIVLNAEKGIEFEISEAGGLICIQARKAESVSLDFGLPEVKAGEYVQVLSVYTDRDGNQAVVPPGWTVSAARRENTIWGTGLGLIIYRIPKEIARSIVWEDGDEVDALQKTYDQFCWVPVKFLDSDGIIDGNNFAVKFGRRNYYDNDLFEDGYHERLKGELLEQKQSVDMFGGFYVSRYKISKSEGGRAVSVKGSMPWTDIDLNDAKTIAATIESNRTVQSHLLFGAEYDSAQSWFIKSGDKTCEELTTEAYKWYKEEEVVKTGTSKATNNVFDFLGNGDEWTQERKGDQFYVIRGGRDTACSEHDRFCDMPNAKFPDTGLHAAFCIKYV